MARRLFAIYRASPFWLRNLLFAPLGRLLGTLLLPFSTIRVADYKMVLDFRDNASFKYLSDREQYEPVGSSVIHAAIMENPGSVVVDLGANYGAFTLPAASLAKRGLADRVIALEPDRRPFRALSASVRLNDMSNVCDVYQMIASDADGTETLWVNGRSSADNRTHSMLTSKIRVREHYQVAATTLDGLFQARRLPTTRTLVIKMDIQGNEPRALAGMKGLLDAAPGWLILFEYGSYLVQSAGLDPEQFFKWLELLDIDTAFLVTQRDGLVELERTAGLISAMRNPEAGASFHGEAPVQDFVIARKMNLTGVPRRGTTHAV